MARATLEMFLKLTGANKTSQGLDKVSKQTKKLDKSVKKSTKENAKFSAGMSGLGSAAITGAAAIAGKSLLDFSLSAIQAASAAQEAAGAFGTTFGGAAEKLNNQLRENANLFGLTTAEAQQLISVFGSVAQGIGFTQEESADLSSELFDLAGDIASFNNITSGSGVVLQAFRSALVGEREALKTYGIAITEAEVQTKAFEQTGKSSADELNRQEKALATTALIFERSAVQQGNAAREASGFAAQTLIARSATQELREELGEELIPAAGEVLRVFNELREDSTPALIERFSDLNLILLGTVNMFDRIRNSLDFKDDQKELVDLSGMLGNNFLRITGFLKLLGIEQKFSILQTEAQRAANLKLTKNYAQYEGNLTAVNNGLRLSRQIVNMLIPQNKKFGQTIDKDLLPTLNKLAKIYGIINQVNAETVDKDNELEEAKNAVAEAQRKESLSTAEEALQKKQLQQEIAELTFFQRQGKDVTEELALAQEKLKDVEFELTRESEELRDAKKTLAEVESDLESAVEDSNSAIQDQIDAINELQEITDLFSADDFKATLEGLADSLGVSYGDVFNDIYTHYLELLEKVNNKPLSVIISEQLDEAGIPEDFMIPSADIQEQIDEIEGRNKSSIIDLIPSSGASTGGLFQRPTPSTIDTGGSFSFLGEDIGAITRAVAEQKIQVEVSLADTAEDFLQVTEKRKASKGYAIS